MLVKKTVEHPAYKRTVVASVICDLCKKEFKTADADEERAEWENHHEVQITGLFIQEGCRYDDCGNLQTLSAHICMKCFRTKLIPWLQSQGVTMTESEKDW